MKAAPTPNPKSFFLFAMRLVISFLVSSVNLVPYFVSDLDVLTLFMIGFRAVKVFVFGGDQEEDRVEEDVDLLPPDLPEENQDPPPLPHPHPPPRPPLPLDSTDKNMIKIKSMKNSNLMAGIAQTSCISLIFKDYLI